VDILNTEKKSSKTNNSFVIVPNVKKSSEANNNSFEIAMTSMTRKQNCVLLTEENWTLQSHDFNMLEEFMKKLNNNWWMKIYITSYCHDICILGEQCCAAQSKPYTTLGTKFP
jgi:hypothetical protein